MPGNAQEEKADDAGSDDECGDNDSADVEESSIRKASASKCASSSAMPIDSENEEEEEEEEHCVDGARGDKSGGEGDDGSENGADSDDHKHEKLVKVEDDSSVCASPALTVASTPFTKQTDYGALTITDLGTVSTTCSFWSFRVLDILSHAVLSSTMDLDDMCVVPAQVLYDVEGYHDKDFLYPVGYKGVYNLKTTSEVALPQIPTPLNYPQCLFTVVRKVAFLSIHADSNMAHWGCFRSSFLSLSLSPSLLVRAALLLCAFSGIHVGGCCLVSAALHVHMCKLMQTSDVCGGVGGGGGARGPRSHCAQPDFSRDPYGWMY